VRNLEIPGWRRVPLSARLLAAVGLVLTLAGAALLGGVAWHDMSRAKLAIGELLEEEQRVLPYLLQDVVVIGDYAALQLTMDHLTRRDRIARLEFQSTTGAKLVSHGKEAGAPSAPHWFQEALRVRDQHATVSLQVGGHSYGLLLITVSSQTTAYEAWYKFKQWGLLLLLALAAELLVLALAVQANLRPLSHLLCAVRMFGGGKLTYRVTPSGSPEFRRVAEGFNDMAQSLMTHQNHLVREKETAERASQAKTEFLSSMTHELRTPMNAILGYGQLLAHDKALNADGLDNVAEILKAGKHLLELINEVLDLSRLESGEMVLPLEPVVISPVLADCLRLTGAMAGERGVSLRTEGFVDLVVVSNRTRLKQSLLNLMTNAIKYNQSGGAVTLRVAELADGRVRIEVEDTGLGIAPERLSEIFQPFNRIGAENSEIEGTGIGLAITRKLVGLMGGAVGVESTEGVGSKFWIDLPVAGLQPQIQNTNSPEAGIAPPEYLDNGEPTK
jgi:signal transduction histidine kinase